MICEKCVKERAKGKLYKFHCGHSQTERTGGDALAKEYTTTAIVVGSDQAWICKRCVNKRVLLTLGLGSLLFLGLIIQSVNADGYLEYYNFSYRIRSLLMDIFGPFSGIQISRVVGTIWSALLSPTILTIWAVGGIGGGFLLWAGLKEIGVVGENLAIKASMSRLQGYSLFLNSRHYKKFVKRSSAS